MGQELLSQYRERDDISLIFAYVHVLVYTLILDDVCSYAGTCVVYFDRIVSWFAFYASN